MELLNNNNIAVGSADGNISLWNLKTKNEKTSFKEHKGIFF